MADISQLIAPKSDQLNSDDLLTGDRIIRIREVKVLGAGKEQPIWIYFDGDNNKPWKPCKTMARLLANLWNSPDTSTWAGKAVHLYHDPDVTWAGAKIGGIRVRAVSHIDAPRQVAISESKTKRKLARIDVLSADVTPIDTGKPNPAQKWATAYIAKLAELTTADELNAFANEKAKKLHELESAAPALHTECVAALDKRRAELAPAGFTDDDLEGGKPIDDRGEGFTDDHTETVAQITALIDQAIGAASYEQAEQEYRKHMMAMPREVAADIEAALRVKKGELGL